MTEDTPPHSAGDVAALAESVLDAEAASHRGGEGHDAVLPDDLLPGVGGASLPLTEVLRAGGFATVFVLTGLSLVENFDVVALAVLGPDIRQSLGISRAELGAVVGVGALLFVLGAVPLGYLADRVRRTWLTAAASALWAVVVMATSLVQAFWQLLIVRFLAGLGKANTLPVHNSLLSDAYPIAGRARIFALHELAAPLSLVIGPLVVGGVAALGSGSEGWRLVFVVIAVPGLVLALFSATLPEPERGKNEQLAVFGETVTTVDEHPISLGVAFERLSKIRTFHFLLLGVGVLGFALFSVPTFLNLLLRDQYGLDAFNRGLVTGFASIGGLLTIPLGGYLADRFFRKSPPSTVLLIAGALAGYGVLFVTALYMPNLPLMVVVLAMAFACSSVAFVPVNALIAAVAPYRLRALAFAMVGIYIFLLGAFFGGVITGALADELGEQAALTIVVPPAAFIGAALIAYGARFVRRDISLVVEELTEEQAERRRVQHRPDDLPVLQVRNLDFSYGSVQVLFDVDLEVKRGEVLALLGTNGAGKSTLLRAISGLGVVDRGVVRFNGRTVTFATAEARVALGIVQVPGGRAVFPNLTVGENLVAGAYGHIWEHERVVSGIERTVELFPKLGERLDQRAGDLSGGEQQMLALARSLLLDPQILLIDELSLGLAPIVVQELLETVEGLAEHGLTIVVVEQSLNVALSIADRAVFMEKGRIRFEGSAEELLERDDIARAVFLGAT